jgi:hypothetical protein
MLVVGCWLLNAINAREVECLELFRRDELFGGDKQRAKPQWATALSW